MTDKSKLHEQTQSISDASKAHLKISKTGETTGAENLFAEAVKASDLTLEGIEKVHAFESNFIAGVSDAFGHAAIGALKKHGDLNSASVSIPMSGKNHLDLTLNRERHYPGSDKVPATTKHAVLDVKYATAEANASAGELKRVKVGLNQAGLEALAGKTPA